jgi:outer membrane protein OmpA-like peptidoglycan-associated protein
MRCLLSILLFIFISGCSVQIVEIAAQPTEQKFDLTDDDRDGVILARETGICVGSFSGVKVDNNGCGVEKPKQARRNLLINFDNNSYLVKPDFVDEIKVLADLMKDHPETNVTIEGHTSILGSRSLNNKLSQNRADAVRDILVNKFSIDKSRIITIGYGFDKLLEEGDTPSIHARNRRIVAELSREEQTEEFKWTIYSVDQPVE